MYPESNFYQVSGYNAHSHGWFKYDDKSMTEAIFSTNSKLFRPGGPDSPIELVLGILPSGASYLLMTSEQMLEFTQRHRLKIPRHPSPWKVANFLSLSPIYFSSLDELSAKVASYKQRPRNKNRREREEILDNSQANRGYVKTGTEVVHYRAYFEQQRTLYRLLTMDLEPGKVGLTLPPWLSCVRVVSLVLGEWLAEKRRRSDRLEGLLLVEVGWTDASFPSFFEKLRGSTVHLKLGSSMKLTNPEPKHPYFSEVVEDGQAGLYSRLRTLFSPDTNDKIPLMVLVHDEDMARAVLSRAGIDTSSWSSGLSNFLIPTPSKHPHKLEEGTPDPVVLPGPSIVDMQKLVKAVMETNSGYTVPQSAKVLRMQTGTKTCAGDDSLLQLHMWTSMAQGLAIDEQHKERLSRQPDVVEVLAPPQQQQVDSKVGLNNMDPNDLDPNDMAPASRPTIADDFSDDDDW